MMSSHVQPDTLCLKAIHHNMDCVFLCMMHRESIGFVKKYKNVVILICLKLLKINICKSKYNSKKISNCINL